MRDAAKKQMKSPSAETKWRLTGVRLHQGVDLWVPHFGVKTGIDISPAYGPFPEGRDYQAAMKYGITMSETAHGDVVIEWIDGDGTSHRSAIGQAVIVSRRYTPVVSEE